MTRALGQFHIAGQGLTTNLAELQAILQEPSLARSLSTAFLSDKEATISAAEAVFVASRTARENDIFEREGAGSSGMPEVTDQQVEEVAGLPGPSE